MPPKKADKRDIAFRGAIGRVMGERGIGKAEIAKAVNKSEKTIYNWMACPATVSLESLRIAVRELKLTDDEVLRTIR